MLVDADPMDRRFDGVPVGLPFSSQSTPRMRPATVRVVVSGPPWLVQSIESTQISAVAEVQQPAPARIDRVPVIVDILVADARRRLITVRSVRPSQR